MTTISLPIEKYTYKQVHPLTKTGKVSKRTEWQRVKVADETECVEFTINYQGKDVTFYVPADKVNGDTEYPHLCDSVIYDRQGNKIDAIWQHGCYGTMRHTEPALFNYVRKQMVERTSYCDGRVKDSYKYLVKVLF